MSMPNPYPSEAFAGLAPVVSTDTLARLEEINSGTDPATATTADTPVPTGPATVASIAQTTNAYNSSPSTGDVTGIPGPAQAYIEQIVNTFAGLLGWPTTVDWTGAMQGLWDSGAYHSPNDAMQWLFNSSLMTPALRADNPWAQFGLDKDSYLTTTEKLQAAWTDLTGASIPDPVMAQAIREQWTPTQMQYFLTYGSPHGPDPNVQAPDISRTPWLATGETYRQQAQSYAAATGMTDANPETVATYYRFNRGAHTLAASTPASLGPAPRAQPAPADVAVR